MRKIIYVYSYWVVKCGWCGRRAAIATDGRNLFCSDCGH